MSVIESCAYKTEWAIRVLTYGDSSPSQRTEAREILDGIAAQADQLTGAVAENAKLRLRVAALENDGMELAAKLGEAEEQIAPSANPTGAVDPETLERHRWALDAAVRFITDNGGNPDVAKSLLVLAEWGQ